VSPVPSTTGVQRAPGETGAHFATGIDPDGPSNIRANAVAGGNNQACPNT